MTSSSIEDSNDVVEQNRLSSLKQRRSGLISYNFLIGSTQDAIMAMDPNTPMRICTGVSWKGPNNFKHSEDLRKIRNSRRISPSICALYSSLTGLTGLQKCAAEMLTGVV